jgi:hypothetical protein
MENENDKKEPINQPEEVNPLMILTDEEWDELELIDEMDLSTITASRIAEAVNLGDDFIPLNPAEEYLKKEIKEHEGIVGIPNDF